MDPYDVLRTATVSSAVQLGLVDSTEVHRVKFRSQYKVRTNLKPEQESELRSIVDFPFTPIGGLNVTSDHPILAALRELTRQVHEHQSGLSHTNLRTLIVGAAMREFSLYNNNPHIDYYMPLKDSRDINRTVLPLVSNILKKLYVKLTKAERVAIKTAKEKNDHSAVITRVQSLTQLSELMQLVDTEKPRNIYNKFDDLTRDYVRLDFQDSIYNFTDEMLYDIFEKTGASEGFGYAIAPLELQFPDMVPSRYYSLTTNGDYTYLNFRFGQCTGYAHKTEAYKTLFNQVYNGKAFSLVKHFEARIGPFVVFRIEKSTSPELIVRMIELPENQQYVKVLDLPESVDHQTGKLLSLKYFSVKKSEYEALQTYSTALQPEAVTMPNLITFIRNRIDGANLVNKQIVRKWDLPYDQIYKLAFCVYFQYKYIHTLEQKVLDNVSIFSVVEHMKRVVKSGFGKLAILFAPLIYLYRLLFDANLVDKIVITPDFKKFEQNWTVKYVNEAFSVPINFNPPPGADEGDCDFCAKFDLIRGQQRVICKHKQSSKHTFKMTTEELAALRAKLADDDNDPPGLKKIKEEAKKNLPEAAFEHSVIVELLRGPPGTGKSYCIQHLASAQDLVYAPFTKLLKDYQNIVKVFTDESGEDVTYTEDLLFKTTHRAFQTRGCLVIWVDEFTAIDYDMLACIVFLNAAEKVFLVGDEKQTRILPAEGTYIGNRVDLEKISEHTLIYNFRNGQDVVAMMNRDHGYQMIPYKSEKRTIFFDDELDLNASDVQTIHFKEVTGAENGIVKNTIRMNQGGTFDAMNLLVTARDEELLVNEALRIVSLTRHKQSLTIKTDKSDTAKAFVAAMGLTDEFYANLDQYIPKLDTLEKLAKPKVTNPELMEAINNFVDAGYPSFLIDNVMDTKFSVMERLQSVVAKVIPRFTELTGRCEICLMHECYCRLLPDRMQNWVRANVRRTMAAHKMLMNGTIPDKLLSMVNIALQLFPTAIYMLQTENITFEEYIVRSGIYQDDDPLLITKLKDMVREKHALFKLFLNVASSFKRVIKKFNTAEFEKYRAFRNMVKEREFQYDMLIEVKPIMDRYVQKKNDKLHTFLTTDTSIPNILKDVPNSEVLDYQELSFTDEIDSDEDYEDLRIFLKNNTPAAPTPIILTEEQQEEEIERLHQEEIDNTRRAQEELLSILPNGFRLMDQEHLIGIYVHGVEIKTFPLNETNACMITAFAEAYGVTRDFVWASLAQQLTLERKLEIYYDNAFLDERELIQLATIFDVTLVVFGHESGNHVFTNVYNEEEAAPPTFKTFLTKNLERLIKKKKSVVINYDSNYANEGYRHYYFVQNNTNIPGAFFPSTYYSDVVFEPTRSIESILNLDGTDQKSLRFNELFTFYHGDRIAEQSFVPVVKINEVGKAIEPRLHPAADSYLLLYDNAPAITKINEHYALNRFATLSLVDDFTNGTYFPDTMMNPINPRGNPVKKTREYFTMTNGYGLHYNQLNQWQELQCLQNRYLCTKANRKWNMESEKLANEIADLFVDEHFEGNYSTFDDSEIYEILSTYAAACRKKHYPSQVIGLVDHTQVRNVRFAMKNIFKPGKLNLDIEKAGQGISAWQKDIQVMIGGVIRVLSRHVSNNLKPGITFNNGMSEKELIGVMNANFNRQFSFCDTAVIDYDCYDATQNRFTQQIERRLMYRLGINQDIIDIYYSFRENYPLLTKILKANGGTTKTSGEPGTLLFNTLLAMALTNWVVRGVLLVVMMGQGDDVIKRVLNVDRELAETRMKLLRQYVDIKMKMEINQQLEFCGFVIADGVLIPSIARKLKKIIGHRFRDYSHFTEYQKSIRESISLIRELGVARVIAENANMMNQTYEEAEQHFNMLESMGHVDEKGFNSLFKKTVVPVEIPALRDGKLVH